MSRRSLRLVLLLLLVCVLALGCSAVAPVAAPAADAPASGEAVTIRFRSYTLGEARDTALRDLITQFEAEYPNIKVEVELPPGDQYWDKLQTEFAGGNAPDITVNQMDWVVPGASRGMFVDLNPLMAE